MGLERWRDIPSWEGFYQVSDRGGVKSLPRQIIRSNGWKQTFPGGLRKPALTRFGYECVILYRPGELKRRLIHQLVLEAFVCQRPEWATDVRHLDGNRANNSLSNLRWGTRSENMQDKKIHGTDYNVNKTQCHRGHKYSVPNLNLNRLRKFGKRQCLSCSYAYQYARYHGLPQSEIQPIADIYYRKIMTENIA